MRKKSRWSLILLLVPLAAAAGCGPVVTGAAPGGTEPASLAAKAKHVSACSHHRCPSPSPVPSSTSPAPVPSTTTPGTTPASNPCPGGTWSWTDSSGGGFWTVPDGEYGIYAGEWNSSLPQTVCANSENDWAATFNAPAGNTGILTYPDVQLNYNTDPPAISNLNPAATASFSESMNANPGTSAEAGFDIWVTGTGCNRCEVMIWTDTVNRGTVGGASDTGHTGTFCGDSSWQLWQDGSELIWYHPANEPSGSVCPAAMLQDLQSSGYLPANAALSQFEDGWEIASTGGVSETFDWTGYSVSGLPPAN